MKVIAICGTVGSGKTTLLKKLMAHFGARAACHEERPQDNPYINEYYADSRRWSFHSQTAFLSLYFDDPAQVAGNVQTELFFYDRSFEENLVLARYRLQQSDLTQDEYDVLERLTKGVAAMMPPIDKYIYLDCSVNTVLARMRGRGREYEDELDLMYVYELRELYEKWRQTLPAERTLRVDMDAPEPDLPAIIRFIEAD